MKVTTCLTPQAALSRLQKSSLYYFRFFIKINPIVINVWVLLIAIGYVFGLNTEQLNLLRFDLGNSTIHCFAYLSGSFVFKLCKWHRMLCISLFIYPILLHLQNAGAFINYNSYILLIISVSGLVYTSISAYYGLRCKKKNKRNVQTIHQKD